MKTYKHLYEDFISDDNIRASILKASIGKRNRKEVRPIIENIDTWIPIVRAYAVNFRNCKHTPKTINEFGYGKMRIIIVPRFMEQIVHHMLVAVLKPIVLKGMYEHSYGSIPDRGLHLAGKRIRHWLKDKKNTKYYLKMDIHHFFASISHDMLKTFISRAIRDEDYLKVLFEVIDVQERGLPLGFLYKPMVGQLVSTTPRSFHQRKTGSKILCPIHGRHGHIWSKQKEAA